MGTSCGRPSHAALANFAICRRSGATSSSLLAEGLRLCRSRRTGQAVSRHRLLRCRTGLGQVSYLDANRLARALLSASATLASSSILTASSRLTTASVSLHIPASRSTGIWAASTGASGAKQNLANGLSGLTEAALLGSLKLLGASVWRAPIGVYAEAPAASAGLTSFLAL